MAFLHTENDGHKHKGTVISNFSKDGKSVLIGKQCNQCGKLVEKRTVKLK